ncbi:MAG: tetratricopeptide repeat protein [Myxococcales bacterium]
MTVRALTTPFAWMLCALLLLAAGCVKKTGSGDGDEAVSHTISKKAYLHLQRVGEHMEKKEYEEALEELDEMAERKYLKPYERATMWRTRAGVHFALTKIDEVVVDLEKSLEYNVLPKEEQLDTEFNLAQAYLMTEKFGKAADMFATWLEKVENPDPSVYFMTASAYSQAGKFEAALPYAKKAVEKMEKTEESWLQLLLSIHYELKQNEEVAELLKRMIKEFNKKEHWLQLSQTYQSLGDSAKALAVLELAYDKGMVTEEKQLLTLARLMLQEGVPLKAGAILEKHMEAGEIERKPETLELLATCWLMAEDRPRAEATLEDAAGAATSGELYVRLAQFHVERHEWAKAQEALTEALKKGDLESEGDAQLLLGIVNYNLKRMGAALTALMQARKHESTKQAAKQWIELVKSESGEGEGAGATDASGGQATSAQPAAGGN